MGGRRTREEEFWNGKEDSNVMKKNAYPGYALKSRIKFGGFFNFKSATYPGYVVELLYSNICELGARKRGKMRLSEKSMYDDSTGCISWICA